MMLHWLSSLMFTMCRCHCASLCCALVGELPLVVFVSFQWCAWWWKAWCSLSASSGVGCLLVCG